jgi:site-specific recombinase XerD
MSALRAALEDYLSMRRALGYKLTDSGSVLDRFVAHLDGQGIDHISAAAALDWSIWTGAPGRDAARRLSAIRLFARYLVALDGKSQVPPCRILPHRVERKTPYIYTDGEVAALLAAARRIEEPFRALATETMIGLLACTGMRPPEACNFLVTDLDLTEAVLTVRESKNKASRLVPLHQSAVGMLARYMNVRQVVFADGGPPGLFMWSATRRFTMERARASFVRLLAQCGIAAPAGQRPPRLWDLRHRFAVMTLVGWYRNGVDVGRALPALSTYMGHERPKDTYWYLQAVPELLGAAAERLEVFLGDAP